MKTLREIHASMKTFNTEEYYLERWDKFLADRPDCSDLAVYGSYMNLEERLEKYYSTMKGVLTEEQLDHVKRSFAPEVAAKAYKELKDAQATVKKYINGEIGWDSKFGFNQYRERFEFNCIQLREFKKKYGVK